MKKNGLFWAAGGLAVVGALIGCNLLEPLGSKHANDQDYRELLIKGNNALSAGGVSDNSAKQALKMGTTADSTKAKTYFATATAHYDTAISYYERAMKRFPQGSEAYLFHSQAIVALYHVDYTRINDEFKKSDNNTGLPFIHDSTATSIKSTVKSVDSIYHPVFIAVQDLGHILRGRDTLWLDIQHSQYLTPDEDTATKVDTASDGRISSSVARLDLGILSAVQGLLAAVDMDGNGRIDSVCGSGITDASLKASLCPKGDSSEVSRLNDLISISSKLSFDSLDTKSFGSTAKDKSDNPNDINSYVYSMQEPLTSAAFNLDSVRSSLKSHNQDSLAKNIASTVTRVRDLANFVGYMQYNDLADDDFDRQDVGSPSPMLWHDYDRNHHIRFNYGDPTLDGYAKYMDSAGYHFGHPGDIGNPFHRHAFPNLYLSYGELIKLHPNLDTVVDASQSGRIHLMQKRCNVLVDSAVFLGGLINIPLPADTIAALRKTCATTSSVLKPTVTPPAASDWVSGTAGVDEELLDNFDNDNDGITDEDARNQRGYDDDNDSPIKLSMINTVIPPMQWRDANGNGCIDMDTLAHPTNATDSLKREFCIGTLEHRLYLAHWSVTTFGPGTNRVDSLAYYYQPFSGESSANTDCKNAFDNPQRLDPAFRAKFKPTTEERDLACQFQSIWNSPVAGYPKEAGKKLLNSEWTGGTFGVDEETCGDKIDNDGDGWVDEDCGDHQ